MCISCERGSSTKAPDGRCGKSLEGHDLCTNVSSGAETQGLAPSTPVGSSPLQSNATRTMVSWFHCLGRAPDGVGVHCVSGTHVCEQGRKRHE
eukprot:6459098-Amphidinium_carterae.1